MEISTPIEFLLCARSYPHPVDAVEHLETHISHIFLTGHYAYKLKKPVKLDFCDFSTLEKRKHFCERELQLNTRYSPELYDSVIALYQSDTGYSFEKNGAPVEYLVRMKQFGADDLFHAMLHDGRLKREHVEGICEKIVRFHNEAELRPEFWGVDEVSGLQAENFDVCKQYITFGLNAELFELVKTLSDAYLQKDEKLIRERQKSHVRAVHGDLHLKNICLFKGVPVLFDGIEFGERYSCCDVWADFAFLYMDLLYHQRADLAYCALNAYLSYGNDFEGLSLLPFFTCYRALVRAKVNCLNLEAHPQKREKLIASANAHLTVARDALKQKPKFFLAIGGLSGSGKTTVARGLSEFLFAVHLRSDVFRKHLAKVSLREKLGSAYYSKEWSLKTYEELLLRASESLESGFSVVLDATFSNEGERKEVEALAKSLEIPFFGIWCEVSQSTALERVEARRNDFSDAGSDVVKRQFHADHGFVSWVKLNTQASQETTLQVAKNLVEQLILEESI